MIFHLTCWNRKSFSRIFGGAFFVLFLLSFTANAREATSSAKPALGREYDHPNFSRVVQEIPFDGIPITIYESQKSREPYLPKARDTHVFTAGSTLVPYFYPQNPSPDGIVLQAQSDYFNLEKSQTLKQKITGLKPNTAYFYRVGDSVEVNRFKTKPQPGAFEPFQFMVISDTQGPYGSSSDPQSLGSYEHFNQTANAERFNKITEAARRYSQPDFIMHCGDIIQDARYPTQWTREMFRDLKYLLTLAPMYPTMGNHEYHNHGFHNYFDLPISQAEHQAQPERAFYSFDWGLAHFIVLDLNGHWYSPSGELIKNELLDEQTKWLEQELSQNQNAKYIFLFTHHPVMYGGNPEPGSRKAVLVEQCEKYRVTATFSGHGHLYGHHRKNGVNYFVTGGGSDETFTALTPGPPETFVFHRFGPQYTVVRVDEQKATVLGVSLDNQVFETTEIPSRQTNQK